MNDRDIRITLIMIYSYVFRSIVHLLKNVTLSLYINKKSINSSIRQVLIPVFDNNLLENWANNPFYKSSGNFSKNFFEGVRTKLMFSPIPPPPQRLTQVPLFIYFSIGCIPLWFQQDTQRKCIQKSKYYWRLFEVNRSINLIKA